MHLIVDYQKRLRESSNSVQVAEENARKFSMEVMFSFFFSLIFMMKLSFCMPYYDIVTSMFRTF
jgi:hypothetical protein